MSKVPPSRASVDALAEILQRDGEDALVLRAVVEALGEIGRPEAVTAAKSLAGLFRRSRDPAVRKAVAETLACLVDASSSPASANQNAELLQVLREALKGGDAETKAWSPGRWPIWGASGAGPE